MKMFTKLRLRRSQAIGFLIITSSLGLAYAGSVTLPHTFSSGTPASAAEVNANFAAVKAAVDDNNTRISATGRIWVPVAPDSAGNTAFSMADGSTTSASVTIGKPGDYRSGGTDDVTFKAVFTGCSGADVRLQVVANQDVFGTNNLFFYIVNYTTVSVAPVTLGFTMTAHAGTMTGFGDVTTLTLARAGGDALDTCTGAISLRGFIVEYPR